MINWLMGVIAFALVLCLNARADQQVVVRFHDREITGLLEKLDRPTRCCRYAIRYFDGVLYLYPDVVTTLLHLSEQYPPNREFGYVRSRSLGGISLAQAVSPVINMGFVDSHGEVQCNDIPAVGVLANVAAITREKGNVASRNVQGAYQVLPERKMIPAEYITATPALVLPEDPNKQRFLIEEEKSLGPIVVLQKVGGKPQEPDVYIDSKGHKMVRFIRYEDWEKMEAIRNAKANGEPIPPGSNKEVMILVAPLNMIRVPVSESEWEQKKEASQIRSANAMLKGTYPKAATFDLSTLRGADLATSRKVFESLPRALAPPKGNFFVDLIRRCTKLH